MLVQLLLYYIEDSRLEKRTNHDSKDQCGRMSSRDREQWTFLAFRDVCSPPPTPSIVQLTWIEGPAFKQVASVY